MTTVMSHDCGYIYCAKWCRSAKHRDWRESGGIEREEKAFEREREGVGGRGGESEREREGMVEESGVGGS